MAKLKPLRSTNSSKVKSSEKSTKSKKTGKGSNSINSKDEVVDDDDDDDESEDDEIHLHSDNNELTEEEYTFEFNDMRPDYTESICSLLKSTLFQNPTLSYEVARTITENITVGTSIVCEGADDVFAFGTILPLKKVTSTPINSIMDEFCTKLKSSSVLPSELKQHFLDSIDNNKAGLMLHKRFTNLPLTLIPLLHKNVIDDLKWSQNDEKDVDYKAIEFVILLSTIDGNIIKGNDAIDVTSRTDIIFESFEDDVYFCEAIGSVCFKTQNIAMSKPIVLSLINIKSLPRCLKIIGDLCG